MPVLYEKHVSEKGKITYREHVPATDPIEDKFIEEQEVVTLLTTLVVSMLMAISGQLVPHARLTREIKLVENAVLRFASLNGAKLEPALIDVGVLSWNAAVRAMQDGLSRARA